jgi:hypothetical protein
MRLKGMKAESKKCPFDNDTYDGDDKIRKIIDESDRGLSYSITIRLEGLSRNLNEGRFQAEVKRHRVELAYSTRMYCFKG